MNKFKIEYLPSAEKDLLEIADYIKADNSSAARDFVDQLDKAIMKLAEFPLMGPQANDQRLRNMGYHLLVFGNYIAFYVLKGETVQIRRILHGRRKYEFLL